jgi:hypothetical protein
MAWRLLEILRDCQHGDQRRGQHERQTMNLASRITPIHDLTQHVQQAGDIESTTVRAG